MLLFNCSSVFAFLQTSVNINFGIARESDTQDTLLISKMRRKKNANLLSFVHTELLETNIIGVIILTFI